MDLTIYDKNAFYVEHISRNDAQGFGAYVDLLKSAYTPLGFFQPDILPSDHAQCFGLRFEGRLQGIFALTPVSEARRPLYTDLIPGISRSRRLLEISNVVLESRVRGAVALGVMLYDAAQHAVRHHYDFLLGITRYQTLPFFIDFGVRPVYHEPLHLLGDTSINDFAIYFDVSTPESVAYMHQRAQRFFEKELVMAQIRSRCNAACLHLRPARAPTPPELVDARH